MKADQALFHAHLEGIPFRSGLDRGRWGHPNGEPDVQWPHCVLWVEADIRFAPLGRLSLRFTLDSYPVQAPTAVPWDVSRGEALPLAEWPRGSGNVSKVFNAGWNANALYAPCDRAALPGHDAWKSTPLEQWWWTADQDITLYLEFVHRCLNPLDHET